MSDAFFDKGWWKDLVVAIIATTVSIILTFGTASLVDNRNRKEDRRMTAMMVMSNIESFARSMDKIGAELAHKDTIAQWLLSLDVDDVEMLPRQAISPLISEVELLNTLQHDKSAEAIFSSNVDTWKNMGSYRFIDNVGYCFSMIDWMEDYWNEQAAAQTEAFVRIRRNPDAFPGTGYGKFFQDREVQHRIRMIHASRSWFAESAYELRRINHENMQIIGIPEQEVMDFTLSRQEAIDAGEEPPNFTVPKPDYHSSELLQPYIKLIESLKNK